ncbi:MAG: potassium/proton antiporter, partial [Oscillospiraceae bacterium]
MALGIFVCAIVIIICISSSKLSGKIGVPTLLLFIILGMLFGCDGIVGIKFNSYDLTEQLCSVALIFIMFYGGFGTSWSAAKPVAVKAILLSTVGVIITAGATGLFCHYYLKMSILDGLLVGCVVSSTDAASVFSILRGKKLGLVDGLASVIEIESGSNDPVAYTLTVVILSLMSADGTVSIPYLVFSQVAYGLGIGFAIAFLSVFILKKVSFEVNGLHTIFVTAIALLAYSLPCLVGGNGYLSVYIVGIVLGNSKILHKVELVHFFDGITWLMQILIFFILGLLAWPSHMIKILPASIAIAFFLTFIARPLATFSILSWFKMPVNQQLFVSWAGLRGAASIVFAIFAMTNGSQAQFDLFHIVFCVAMLSVGIQGTLLIPLAKILGLVNDDHNTVLKTFTDYQEETDLNLMELKIEPNSGWVGCSLSQLNLSSDILVVMIKRSEGVII